MKIDGMNFVSGLKVTNSVKKQEQNKSNTSFKGHLLTYDNQGRPVYKFFLPNAAKGTKLQIAVMKRDENGKYSPTNDVEEFDMPEGYKSIDILAKRYLKEDDSILGYKFITNGKAYTDKSVRHESSGYNYATRLDKANPHRNRQMLHLLVDSFNVKDPANAAKRNHFNCLGGTIESVTEKVPELAKMGYGELIAPPIIGDDNKSSHGYWTVNPYHITKKLGTYKDFQKLMITLFQNGMGWTADGAFVNEGIEGVRVRDIQNWGALSPFLPMFETKDVENTQLRFGVLSKNDAANKHIHIKLVNAPYKIEFEKTADGYKEKQIVKNRVDSSKSTYIQLFDDRLVSDKQANDDKIFDVYDIKEAEDSYQIASVRDSVQPLNFRVLPSEVEANYEKFKENQKIDKNSEFKNFLTKWTNFSLVNSNKDGGASLWDGNNDILKKRFVLTENALKSLNLKGEEEKKVIAGQYQVLDDTVNIGKFWTGEAARIITEYAAKMLSDRVKQYMSEAEDNKKTLSKKEAYEKAVNSLVEEKLLPPLAKIITEHEVKDKDKKLPSALDNMLTFDVFAKSVEKPRMYKLRPTVMPENITDGIMSYPMEAIEVSTDLISVFAYPFIKNQAVTEDTVGLTRYEMYKMGDEYYNQMPEVYRKTYKKADELYAGLLTDKALQIMKTVNADLGTKWFNGDELTTEGREAYSLVAHDVAKFLFVSAIAPDVDFDENSEILEYDLDKLREYDLNKANLQYETTPENAAIRLLEVIQEGVENIPEEKLKKFEKHLANRLKGIDSDAINVAKLIVDRTESGLDWRIDAAKDVGDLDAVKAGRFAYDRNIDRIAGVWNKFNVYANKYNPNSYKIGELTDITPDKFEFVDKSMFDTLSEYTYFFSGLLELYGQDDEGKSLHNFYSSVRKKLEEFSQIGSPDNLNFTHRFVGNHDKTRVLHILATNVAAFNEDKSQEVQRVLENGFYKSEEFNKLPEAYKEAIKKGIADLREGIYHVNGEKRFFDSENFAVRPFDYSIADSINEARFYNKEFDKFAKENPETIEKMKGQTLKAVLLPALTKYRAILFAMIGLPGTPTHYAGDELAQTGWETFCKNEKQENRNVLRWDWLKDKNYDFVEHFYETEYKPLIKIRSMDGASALVNGATQPMGPQYMRTSASRGGAVALYRYNDKTDAIVVLHGEGYGRMPENKGQDAYMDYIDLDDLTPPIKAGVVYVDALNPSSKYMSTNIKFKINNGNDEITKTVIKKLDNNQNPTQGIALGNAGLILLRESSFDGKKYSFKGRIENPHVKLANTKYNI